MIEITLRLRSHDFYKFWVVEAVEGQMMNNETWKVTKELPQPELDRYNDRIFEKIPKGKTETTQRTFKSFRRRYMRK